MKNGLPTFMSQRSGNCHCDGCKTFNFNPAMQDVAVSEARRLMATVEPDVYPMTGWRRAGDPNVNRFHDGANACLAESLSSFLEGW